MGVGRGGEGGGGVVSTPWLRVAALVANPAWERRAAELGSSHELGGGGERERGRVGAHHESWLPRVGRGLRVRGTAPPDPWRPVASFIQRPARAAAKESSTLHSRLLDERRPGGTVRACCSQAIAHAHLRSCLINVDAAVTSLHPNNGGGCAAQWGTRNEERAGRCCGGPHPADVGIPLEVGEGCTLVHKVMPTGGGHDRRSRKRRELLGRVSSI